MSADVTSWRDGGGRAMAPTLSGEGAVDGGSGGNLVMDGAAGVPTPNSQSHGPPRIPAGNPVLPLPQPPVGPGFPQYRGIMPPFVSTAMFPLLFLDQFYLICSHRARNRARTALLFCFFQKIHTNYELCVFLKMFPPYMPFPGPYGPQGPYRYPAPGEGPSPR